MGRPPCRDKVEVKKGPWTPAEDIILVSYIQEHGPGNWRSVPVNTGLMRCSKSCRLRWTNYLRPGIKRGNFTPHEEGVILHLQSLKKKQQQAMGAIFAPSSSSAESANPAGHLDQHHQHHNMVTASSCSKADVDGYGAHAACSNPEVSAQLIARRRSPFAADADCSSSSYASSMDNISTLLNGFMKSSTTRSVTADVKPGASVHIDVNPLLSLDRMSGTGSAELTFADVQQPALMGSGVSYDDDTKQQQQAPLSSIEKWLLDEAASRSPISWSCLMAAAPF